MKNLLGLALVYLSISGTGWGQHLTQADVDKVFLLDEQLQLYHIEYDQQRARLANRLGGEFAAVLDQGARYLTEAEVAFLSENISNETLDNPVKMQIYIDSACLLLKNQYLKIQNVLEAISVIDFFEPDSVYYQVAPDSMVYARGMDELEKYWLQHLKLSVLYRVHPDSLSRSGRHEINELLNGQLAEVMASESCKLQTQINHLETYVVDSFLKAYARCFDPHSDFISSAEQDVFLSSLSSRIFSTGLQVQKQDNRFLITQILATSAACEQEDISVGDEITAIKKKDQMIPPQCLTQTELNELFYGATAPVLGLEIRSKLDHKYRHFDLGKRHLDNIANHTFRYLLAADSLRLGYVFFPGFYSDDIGGGKSSGQDLALILLELNKKDIDGLIIDLRDNGGGSIGEAIDLAGFFVDYGPLFMITDRVAQEGYLYKDTRKGKIYEGKVMFLVNSLTASASEMVVSALRHYPNQLVVGSQTFGKATGQSLIPLMDPNGDDSFGMAKITTLRVHEISGGTYQSKGLLPDIEWPTFPSRRLVGEHNYRYSLPTKMISKSFQPKEKRNLPLRQLSAQCLERWAQNEQLSSLKVRYDSIETTWLNGFYQPLEYDKFSCEDVFLSDSSQAISNMEVVTLEADSAFRSFDAQLTIELQEDAMIHEAFQIFKDWIQLDKY